MFTREFVNSLARVKRRDVHERSGEGGASVGEGGGRHGRHGSSTVIGFGPQRRAILSLKLKMFSFSENAETQQSASVASRLSRVSPLRLAPVLVNFVCKCRYSL